MVNTKYLLNLLRTSNRRGSRFNLMFLPEFSVNHTDLLNPIPNCKLLVITLFPNKQNKSEVKIFMILWHFTRCGEFSKGLMCLSTSGNCQSSAPASHRRGLIDSCRRTLQLMNFSQLFPVRISTCVSFPLVLRHTNPLEVKI